MISKSFGIDLKSERLANWLDWCDQNSRTGQTGLTGKTGKTSETGVTDEHREIDREKQA